MPSVLLSSLDHNLLPTLRVSFQLVGVAVRSVPFDPSRRYTMVEPESTEVQHGQSNSALIYVPCGIFLFLCPLLVGTRLWSRTKKGGQIGADDYTILASLVS